MNKLSRKSLAGLALLLSLCGPSAAFDPKYGPAEKPIAMPLSQDNAYFREPGRKAPDFWRLNSFYVPQYTEYACSAAAVSMALNALLNTDRPRGDLDKNITQADIVEKVPGEWQALLSPAGLEGRHGLSLARLEAFMKAAFQFYSASKLSVEKHEAVAADEATLKDFRDLLSENEKNPDDIIVVHFVQDDLTKAKGGPYPHISPIGAYDEARGRILVFDVDREWYEPYWVPVGDMLKAMARETKAFGHGGYVRVAKAS